ncbi:MAG: PIN domain-containing protein [Limisphaerales bacterium]
MNYLVDTNIFLEILLGQPNKEDCKQFLRENSGQCGLSDFSLHSIGVITFRGRRPQAYRAFLHDMLPGVALLHLDKQAYPSVLQAHERLSLDFDDAYQFCLAQRHSMTLVTQDRDFVQVKQEIPVRFL